MALVVAAKKLSKYDPKTFLSTIDGGRKIAPFSKRQTIFGSLLRVTRPMLFFMFKKEK